jgi:hypothetical protein
MPYFANTAGALAAMPARSPAIFASPEGHSRDNASPNDDRDMREAPKKKPPEGGGRHIRVRSTRYCIKI